jgi:hypothetical protein
MIDRISMQITCNQPQLEHSYGKRLRPEEHLIDVIDIERLDLQLA